MPDRPADEAPASAPASAPDPRLLRLGVVLHELSWRMRRRGPADVGLAPLPPTELEVLRHVTTHPGASVGDAAQALGLRASNASAAVRGLAERGLLDRRPDPDDGRVVRLHPSGRAEEHRRMIEGAWARVLGDAMAPVAPEDVERLLAAAEVLEQVLGGVPPEHRPG